MYVKTIIIISAIIIVAVILFFRGSKVRDNGSPIDEARDNNIKSKDINIQTGIIVDQLKAENNEAGRLNKSIREDNQTAGDIIAEIRKQKLD